MIFIDHDHYIYLFYKQLDILINLKKNKITMSIMIKDMQLLENYNKIWKKIEELMNIHFESETTYGIMMINTWK